MKKLHIIILLLAGIASQNGSAAQTRVNLNHEGASRADNQEYVVVYPEGLQQQWNYLHGISGIKTRPNDSEFLLKTIDAVKNEYSIYDKRICVTGISSDVIRSFFKSRQLN